MTDTALSDARQAAATEPSATEPAPLPAKDDAPAPGTEQTPPTDAKPADEKPKPDPKDLAIRRLAFEQRETQRQLKATREALERAQPAKDPNAPLTQADIDRLVDERAEAKLAAREQTAKNEAWVAAGNADYPDFTEKCNVLADIGAGDNPAFMAAIGKLPAGHKVVAELAADPAEATRILKLSPVELALELAGISTRIAVATAPEPKAEPVLVPVTKAPPPIRPLAAAATARTDKRPEDMSSDEYQAYWNKRSRG